MIWPSPYVSMARYTRPARQGTGPWAVALTIVAFELSFALTGLIYRFVPVEAVATAWMTVLDFAVFAIPAAILVFAVKLFHGRPAATLFGAPVRAPFVKAAWAVALVLAVQEPLLLWLDFQGEITIRAPLRWAPWLIPGLFAILIQVGTEELFYRGYLQQQLGALSARPLVWMVLPSVYFGCGHLYNGETLVEGILWAIWAAALGLACADLTARTGSIGAAVGLHFSNNIFATVVVETAGAPMSGLALLLYPPEAPVEMDPGLVALVSPFTVMDLILTVLSIGVMWLAARVALRV